METRLHSIIIIPQIIINAKYSKVYVNYTYLGSVLAKTLFNKPRGISTLKQKESVSITRFLRNGV